jgi:hypothetical protein
MSRAILLQKAILGNSNRAAEKKHSPDRLQRFPFFVMYRHYNAMTRESVAPFRSVQLGSDDSTIFEKVSGRKGSKSAIASRMLEELFNPDRF